MAGGPLRTCRTYNMVDAGGYFEYFACLRRVHVLLGLPVMVHACRLHGRGTRRCRHGGTATLTRDELMGTLHDYAAEKESAMPEAILGQTRLSRLHRNSNT